MLRAIAIDDEPLPLELLQEFCSQIDFISLEKTFTNINEARTYLSKFPVDVLFLDIQMPKVSGIDFYKSLKQETMVIFTTAYSQYAIDGFDLNAVDYLLKPFSFTRFKQAVDKAYKLYRMMFNLVTGDRSKHLMLKSINGVVKVVLSDITFIEGLDNYLKINLRNDHIVVIRMTLKTLIDRLNPEEFVRIHRSYIVSVTKVEAIKRKTIYLSGGQTVPIGRNYEDIVKSTFETDK